jgi:hypothetical protein
MRETYVSKIYIYNPNSNEKVATHLSLEQSLYILQGLFLVCFGVAMSRIREMKLVGIHDIAMFPRRRRGGIMVKTLEGRGFQTKEQRKNEASDHHDG